VLRAWWVVTFPGMMIFVVVLAFNLLGDGLRDAFDPKLKR
jgi:dipeptide transport system permease protein